MTIRLLVEARGQHRVDFTRRLVELSGGAVELTLHMGHDDADFHAPSLAKMDLHRGRAGHFMAGQRQTGANFPLIASQNFGDGIEMVIDQMQRFSPDYRYRGHNLRNLQDYLDYFHILSDVMAQKMLTARITHAVFWTVPHLGYDTLLYQVAQALGIKTLILSQTLFDKHFWSMANVMDYGLFDPARSTAPPFHFEKGSVADLYYMQDDWQKPGKTGTLSSRAVGQMVLHFLRHDPIKLANPAYIAGVLKRMRHVYEGMPDWRDPFARFFHTNELAYFEHLIGFEGGQIDLDQKYIYVPLHNQPEMSTSALGGIYRDQVLLIETLARQLPAGWRIYVKENPRQGSFARGPLFFHRLTRIPSVTLMPSNANTFALSANAQFVATVTGTAGWEAIRQGRPALVFGAAFYQSLPGIVRYREGLDFAEVAATQIDHDALEKATGAMFGQGHDGIIEEVYFKKVPGFDYAANRDKVARTTLDVLQGNAPLSFYDPDGGSETL